jgi:hypothetical protein
MKLTLSAITLFLCSAFVTQAQFAPQVGILGCNAIHKSDASIKSWAKSCNLQRGFMDIANPSLGYTSVGDSSNALGMADAQVVSLGDSGLAIISFSQPLFNGVGADFAIFENGFQNPSNLEEAFLELAFIEVSSDGEHFFRFPATSNTDISTQIKGAGDYMNARLVNNLGGKFISQYGTPFDLDEMTSIDGLDVNNITKIRIVDVIGSVNGRGSIDGKGQIVNDPYPTPFPSGGFDLDAVAAINIKGASVSSKMLVNDIQIFPNPATTKMYVDVNDIQNLPSEIILSDVSGKVVSRQTANRHNELSVSELNSGLFFIGFVYSWGIQWVGKCSKI